MHMHVQVEASDVQAARAVAKKALQVIDSRYTLLCVVIIYFIQFAFVSSKTHKSL